MKNLKIIFQYNSIEVENKENSIKNVPTTTCQFKTKEKIIIASRTVILHNGDINNKLVGRTYAFKKCVNTIKNKDTRRVLWTKFRKEMKQVS